MRSSSVPPALVGRADDLQILRSAFAEAVDGTARTVIVGGEAGIGKTRLIAEFTATLPADTLLLRGQCVDLEHAAPPHAPIAAALRELVRLVGDDAVLRHVGAAHAGLRTLLPGLGAAGSGAAGTSAAGTRNGSGAGADPSGSDALGLGSASATAATASLVFDAVTALLESVSLTSPVVLIIEDLHWADQASLSLLRFVVKVATRGRLLVVMSYRTDGLRRGHPLRSWLPELERSDRVERRELARLTRKQVRDMIESITGAAPTSRDLALFVERTDGVPFLIEEIVNLGEDARQECVPDSLRDILLARYDALGDDAQRVVRLLSAGGTCVEHSLLAAVWTGDQELIDVAAREAVATGVLEIDETFYTFRHALVRDAIHDELLPGERVRFHTAYARALEAANGGGPAETSDGAGGGSSRVMRGPASEISYHWMAAHDVRAAFTASLRAMAEARSSSAHTTAARMGERAIELWDQVVGAESLAGRTRTVLLAETSRHLRNAGESERAIALVDEAIAGVDATADPAVAARLLRDRASYLANLGQPGSVPALRRALDLLGGSDPSVLRAAILGELSARLMLESRFAEAVETADDAYREAETVGSNARMSVAVNIRGVALVQLLEIDRGLEELQRARLLAEAGEGDDSALLRHWINQSDTLAQLGRFAEAVDAATEGAEHARRRGFERTTGAMLAGNAAEPLFALGEWERADALLDTALDLDSPIGYAAHLQRRKLSSTLWQGDVAGAVALLRQWRAALSRQLQTDSQSLLGLARVAGEIAIEDDRTADAWAEVAPLFSVEHRRFPAYDLPLLAVAARVLGCARSKGIRLEGDADAETVMRRALDAVDGWPTAPLVRAVIDAELGGPDGSGDDVEAWRAARRAAESPLASAQVRAHTSIRWAEALAAAGDREGAADAARDALEIAEPAGLGLVLARVGRLESRLGPHGSWRGTSGSGSGAESADSPGEDDPGVIAGLTARERQVLDLVAQGLGNRQIADELFISIKTASVHVSNILRKLGASTRTEAAYLARTPVRSR